MNINIRRINQSELYLLEDFLYEAIFQRDADNLLPRDIINEPAVRVYINQFGKPDDLCLLAEIDGTVVGAVWTRILSGEVKGFGNIDNETPEFIISVYKQYRKQGIGTKLMQRMLKLLKQCGYKQTSLSVQKDNYAFKMYKNLGFDIVKELDEEYIMVCNLNF